MKIENRASPENLFFAFSNLDLTKSMSVKKSRFTEMLIEVKKVLLPPATHRFL